jgi:hypothetical protein
MAIASLETRPQNKSPERKALKWFLLGGVIGATVGGLPVAILGAFGAGGVSWYQARFGERRK